MRDFEQFDDELYNKFPKEWESTDRMIAYEIADDYAESISNELSAEITDLKAMLDHISHNS